MKTALMGVIVPYILGVLLIIGCGRLIPDKPLVAPEEVVPYVESFLDDAAARRLVLSSNNLTVEIVDEIEPKEKNTTVVGVCEHIYKWDKTSLVVTLLQSYWDESDEGSRKQLIYHELGHCLLDRPHIKGEVKEDVPISIMVAETFSGETLIANESYYLDELFSVRGGLHE